MLEFFKRNRLRISIIFVTIFLLFYLIVQIDTKREDNWFSAVVQNIAYPFQSSFYFLETSLSNVWSYYIWLVNTKDENDRLIRKVKLLEEENAANRETQYAYHRLLKLLEFKKKDPNKKIFAEVIVEIKKPFYKLWVINKGSKDGIRPNFSVVTPEGIVGKIQSVTSFQSMVQLITDSHSQLPVLIQRTRTKAMLQVRDGKLIISGVPRRLELFESDRVVTSGLAGIFPKGFTVGKIKKIDKKQFGLFQNIVLSPAVDLNKVEEVAVILESVYNIHQPLFTNKKK